MWKFMLASVSAVVAGVLLFKVVSPTATETVSLGSDRSERAQLPEYTPEELSEMTPETLMDMQKKALDAAAKAAQDARELETLDGRPDFVSPAEWVMLKAVASQKPTPDKELLRLVNLLRFNKQLEALDKTLDSEERLTLSETVLEQLPQRIENQEMSVEKAQRIQLRIISAMYEDEDRIRSRAAEEARRIGSEFSIKASG